MNPSSGTTDDKKKKEQEQNTNNNNPTNNADAGSSGGASARPPTAGNDANAIDPTDETSKNGVAKGTNEGGGTPVGRAAADSRPAGGNPAQVTKGDTATLGNPEYATSADGKHSVRDAAEFYRLSQLERTTMTVNPSQANPLASVESLLSTILKGLSMGNTAPHLTQAGLSSVEAEMSHQQSAMAATAKATVNRTDPGKVSTVKYDPVPVTQMLPTTCNRPPLLFTWFPIFIQNMVFGGQQTVSLGFESKLVKGISEGISFSEYPQMFVWALDNMQHHIDAGGSQAVSKTELNGPLVKVTATGIEDIQNATPVDLALWIFSENILMSDLSFQTTLSRYKLLESMLLYTLVLSQSQDFIYVDAKSAVSIGPSGQRNVALTGLVDPRFYIGSAGGQFGRFVFEFLAAFPRANQLDFKNFVDNRSYQQLAQMRIPTDNYAVALNELYRIDTMNNTIDPRLVSDWIHFAAVNVRTSTQREWTLPNMFIPGSKLAEREMAAALLTLSEDDRGQYLRNMMDNAQTTKAFQHQLTADVTEQPGQMVQIGTSPYKATFINAINRGYGGLRPDQWYTEALLSDALIEYRPPFEMFHNRAFTPDVLFAFLADLFGLMMFFPTMCHYTVFSMFFNALAVFAKKGFDHRNARNEIDIVASSWSGQGPPGWSQDMFLTTDSIPTFWRRLPGGTGRLTRLIDALKDARLPIDAYREHPEFDNLAISPDSDHPHTWKPWASLASVGTPNSHPVIDSYKKGMVTLIEIFREGWSGTIARGLPMLEMFINNFDHSGMGLNIGYGATVMSKRWLISPKWTLRPSSPTTMPQLIAVDREPKVLIHPEFGKTSEGNRNAATHTISTIRNYVEGSMLGLIYSAVPGQRRQPMPLPSADYFLDMNRFIAKQTHPYLMLTEILGCVKFGEVPSASHLEEIVGPIAGSIKGLQELCKLFGGTMKTGQYSSLAQTISHLCAQNGPSAFFSTFMSKYGAFSDNRLFRPNFSLTASSVNTRERMSYLRVFSIRDVTTRVKMEICATLVANFHDVFRISQGVILFRSTAENYNPFGTNAASEDLDAYYEIRADDVVQCTFPSEQKVVSPYFIWVTIQGVRTKIYPGVSTFVHTVPPVFSFKVHIAELDRMGGNKANWLLSLADNSQIRLAIPDALVTHTLVPPPSDQMAVSYNDPAVQTLIAPGWVFQNRIPLASSAYPIFHQLRKVVHPNSVPRFVWANYIGLEQYTTYSGIVPPDMTTFINYAETVGRSTIKYQGEYIDALAAGVVVKTMTVNSYMNLSFYSSPLVTFHDADLVPDVLVSNAFNKAVNFSN